MGSTINLYRLLSNCDNLFSYSLVWANSARFRLGHAHYRSTAQIKTEVNHTFNIIIQNVWWCFFFNSFYTTSHRWLADLAAPVGSQEVVDHTHKWWTTLACVSLKILLGPNLHCLGDPTCTQTVRNGGPNLHPGKC